MAVAAVDAGGCVDAVVAAAVVAGFSSYLTSSCLGAAAALGCGFFF